MVKNKLGELKLSPIKEDGKFVFFNDFITINGKVAKGDRIKIFVDGYELANGKYFIKAGTTPQASVIVRGQEHNEAESKSFSTVEDYYEHVTELYRQQFYFGKKTP